MQDMAEEWDIMERVEMICHDSAVNMLGVYNISDFQSHCVVGRCVNHILQLCIKVLYVKYVYTIYILYHLKDISCKVLS